MPDQRVCRVIYVNTPLNAPGVKQQSKYVLDDNTKTWVRVSTEVVGPKRPRDTVTRGAVDDNATENDSAVSVYDEY